MKIGQTSLIVFISEIIGSILGFFATLYIARLLGPEVFGIYSAMIAVGSWLQLSSGPGVGIAAKKRISEGEGPGEYLVATAVIFLVSFIIISILVIILQEQIESYLNAFSKYSSISVVWFLLGILAAMLSSSFVSVILQGQDLVHIAGFLRPTKIALRSLSQILLIFFGLGLIGVLLGHIGASLIVAIVGLWLISVFPRYPATRHFRSLLSYAKYSWLGALKSRAFQHVDILVLTAFVPTSLVGIYSVAWSLTTILAIFGRAVGQAVFPEISNITSQHSIEEAKGITEDAVAFAGLVAIPGFIGGTILSDRILRIYGSEFVNGTEVLWLLLLSILFFSYMRQFLNVLNAVDRPDLAFRLNLIFIVANVVLNFILIIYIGWVGAAIASALSTGLGLSFSALVISKVLEIEFPFAEIGKQVVAALLMGGLVWGIRRGIEYTKAFQHNLGIILLLIAIGTTTYVTILLIISRRFWTTVSRNIPFDIL
jgi:O-antigen/teichoic acid export membrane protein